ncbi:hypothetical protein [Streptomyces sp. SID13031]|uniref:hypothetical protein n=1 Tax=Streptomyces sp. SID13031 TaxID=2706046 RepID=UPI0013C6EE2D|nr:hypothetical protein [Streptomyces sp. SID13031]NEA34991.1 hypothetical protein [Streptomyces sp. SID13031]
MSNESYPERIVRSTPVAIAAAVVDIAAFFSLVLSSSIRSWVKTHPLHVAITGLLIILTLVFLTNRLAQSRATLRAESLAKAHEISDLKTRLHPTPRDKEKFERLLGEFPMNTGTIPFLETFPGKQWQNEYMLPIFGFLQAWRYEEFDDAVTQKAFSAFREKVQKLSSWFASEGFPHSTQTGISELPAPHEFEGGYDEFFEVREKGERLAQTVVEGRLEIERIGRQRGL